MKWMLFVGGFALAVAGRAFAADLPVPAPALPVIYQAPLNWSGGYIGVNVGYGFGSSDWGSTLLSTGNFGVSGPLGGGTIGLNLQTGDVVLGFEADGDWGGLSGRTSNIPCSTAAPGAACETQNQVLATARARLGYAFNRILVYGTAGGAFGNVHTTINPPGLPNTTNNVGWAAGFGAEFAFTEFWSAKVEYLFIDITDVTCVSENCGLTVPISSAFTANTVRAGVNFRFAPW